MSKFKIRGKDNCTFRLVITALASHLAEVLDYLEEHGLLIKINTDECTSTLVGVVKSNMGVCKYG